MTILTNLFELKQREHDGYVNLTELAEEHHVKVGDWTRLRATKRYVAALSRQTGIPSQQLLNIKKGHSPKFNQGTIAHPLIAIAFKRWIKAEYAIAYDEVLLEKSRGIKEAIAPSEKPITALPETNPKDDCISQDGMVSGIKEKLVNQLNLFVEENKTS